LTLVQVPSACRAVRICALPAAQGSGALATAL
jgi:hypothetical protein